MQKIAQDSILIEQQKKDKILELRAIAEKR